MAARRSSILPAGRSKARATAALPTAAAGLIALSLVLPHPHDGDGFAFAMAVAMAALGAAAWLLVPRIPTAGLHAMLVAVSAANGFLIYETGIAVGQYGAIFVWATLIASVFFPRRVASLHLAWLLLVYAVALLGVESTAGYSPLTRWVFTAVSLLVVMVLTTGIVLRRAGADERARRFFELSRDMLCTVNREGYFVELNGAWSESLGYTSEELRAIPFIERVHPQDRPRTEAEALQLFEGRGSALFENRYLAKDGSWHWLRWSSQLSADEHLVYARATDITELKRIEAEREELLGQVQEMAHRDALTGLPNRRMLQEQLPRAMARARRAGAPLCVAILDMDHFKAYNDANGHLAGDEVLQQCAIAWDTSLRGEDTVVRFGGEEFLVLLPDTGLDQALEIVERLRGATPLGQTCSAGIACWDGVETAESLLERADVALYMAKASGRDRIVEAPPSDAAQS